MKDFESRDYIVRTAQKMVTEKYDWDFVAAQMKSEISKRVAS
jgi:hypothetical protein